MITFGNKHGEDGTSFNIIVSWLGFFCIRYRNLGIPTVQFLIACSMQNWW